MSSQSGGGSPGGDAGSRFKQLFLEPASTDGGEIEYVPRLYFECKIDFSDVRSGYRETMGLNHVAELPLLDEDTLWTRDMIWPVDASRLQAGPREGKFAALPDYVDDEHLARLESLYMVYLTRHFRVTLWRNADLDLYSAPHEGPEDFARRCLDTESESFRKDLDASLDLFQRRLEQLREKFLGRPEENRAGKDFHSERRDSRMKSRVNALSTEVEELFLAADLSESDPPEAMAPGEDTDLAQSLFRLRDDVGRAIARAKREHRSRALCIDEYTMNPNLKDIHLVRTCILWTPREAVA